MKSKRLVLDSNIYDCFLNGDLTLNEELISCVNECTESGKLVIFVTHVQVDEHNATPNENKRNALAAVRNALMIELIMTSGAIGDVSRWDMCTYESAGLIELQHIQIGNPKHAEDALITATASAGADVLVTNETRLRNKINSLNTPLSVWTFNDLIAFAQCSQS